mmetsp:Transcript_6657/g.8141  ORF Transcript_6657/g.8141 Transcript_6657/m.8141 type:complete len:88 (+) Transcript_6657:36-299(+)
MRIAFVTKNVSNRFHHKIVCALLVGEEMELVYLHSPIKHPRVASAPPKTFAPTTSIMPPFAAFMTLVTAPGICFKALRNSSLLIFPS